MPKPLKSKTINIISMLRLNIRFTFRTRRDIILRFGWFDFDTSEGFHLDILLSLEIWFP
jgi:hypothetical protein